MNLTFHKHHATISQKNFEGENYYEKNKVLEKKSTTDCVSFWL